MTTVDPPSDSEPTRISAEIDRLCDDFERAWKNGKRPSIEPLLSAVAPTSRSRLLSELLPIEFGYRHQAGDEFSAAEYRSRFADFAAVVEQCLAAQAFGTDGPSHPTEAPPFPTVGPLSPAGATKRPSRPTIDEGSHPTVEFRPPPTSDGEAASEPWADSAFKALDHALPGRFRVVRRLGRGGFADVYLASDTILQRDVAIKVPRNPSDDQISLILREAQSVAKLDHRAIVRIYDVLSTSATSSGAHIYIVMQYIDGGSLDKAINERLPFDRTIDLMTDITEAVAAAHKKNLIHRDLKPANILLDGQGRPYVADFGLAIHHESRLMHVGERSGTPAYMSPEQWDGRPSDPSDDVWSLGVVLYQLLTGVMPFGSDPTLTPERARRQPPRLPREIDATIPEELEAICLRCLEKAPRDRYAGVEEIHREFWKLKAQQTVGPDPAQRERALLLERQAFAQLESGDFSEAVQRLDSVVQLVPDHPGGHYLRGLARLMMMEELPSAVEELERAVQLDPNQASACYALANIYEEVGRRDRVVAYLETAIAGSPENRDYRQMLDRVRSTEEPPADARPTREIIERLAPHVKRRLSELARTIFARDVTRKVSLDHWTTLLPPWSFLRPAPVARTALFTLSALVLVVLLHLPEWSTVRVVQQVVIWSLIAQGCLMPFLAGRLLQRTYAQLVPIVMMPEDAFRRFFLEQCTFLFGATANVQTESAAPSLRDQLLRNWPHLLVAGACFLGLLFFQYVCAADHPTGFSPALVLRYISYVLQAYVLVWAIPFAIFGLWFIPRFGTLPLRYFLGMPDSVSLKTLGAYYLKLTFAGAMGYTVALFQHYVFRTHATSPIVSVSYIVICSAWLVLIMLVTQWQLYHALRRLKHRRLLEYSYHLEEAFERQMKQPSREAQASVDEHVRFMRQLRKLDTRALSTADFVKLALMSAALAGAVAAYAYAVRYGLWLI
jgi:tetratricopeptide (TPR) repeat protein